MKEDRSSGGGVWTEVRSSQVRKKGCSLPPTGIGFESKSSVSGEETEGSRCRSCAVPLPLSLGGTPVPLEGALEPLIWRFGNAA